MDARWMRYPLRAARLSGGGYKYMTFDKYQFERSFGEALRSGKFVRTVLVLALVVGVFVWLCGAL